jgi:hypothetical protein
MALAVVMRKAAVVEIEAAEAAGIEAAEKRVDKEFQWRRIK